MAEHIAPPALGNLLQSLTLPSPSGLGYPCFAPLALVHGRFTDISLATQRRLPDSNFNKGKLIPYSLSSIEVIYESAYSNFDFRPGAGSRMQPESRQDPPAGGASHGKSQGRRQDRRHRTEER